jgi:hypothetical protein
MAEKIDLAKCNDMEIIAVNIIKKWTDIAHSNVGKIFAKDGFSQWDTNLDDISFGEDFVNFRFITEDYDKFTHFWSLAKWIEFVREIESANVDASCKSSL